MWIKRSEYERLVNEKTELRKLVRIKDPKTGRYVKSGARGGNNMDGTIEYMSDKK